MRKEIDLNNIGSLFIYNQNNAITKILYNRFFFN